MSKKQFWLTTLMSSFTMASMMSGIISGYKMNFSAEWPPIWLQSFLLAWPFAILLNLTVLPQVRKFAGWLCQPKKPQSNTVNQQCSQK